MILPTLASALVQAWPSQDQLQQMMMNLSSLEHLLAQPLAEVVWGLEPWDHPLIWPLLQTLVPRLWRRHQQLSLRPRCFRLPCRHSARSSGRRLVQCGRAIVHALLQLLVLHA